MITHQLALLKREIWEHRSIYVTPAGYRHHRNAGRPGRADVRIGFRAELDIAIFGAQNLAGDPERKAALTASSSAHPGYFLLRSRSDRLLLSGFAVRRTQRQKHSVLALAAGYRRRNGHFETDYSRHRHTGCHGSSESSRRISST